MEEKKEFRDYRYLPREDYDKSLKINAEAVPLYSEDKLKERYPEGDYVVRGETFERKKRDKESDIGRIELAEKWLYVSENGRHNKLLRKVAAYAEVEGGGFIALLKLRLLPFLLALALVLLILLLALLPKPTESTVKPVDIEKEDPNMSVAEEILYAVSGTVTKGGEPVEGASLSLRSGSDEVAAAATDASGAYGFQEVNQGLYNVVCTVGDSVLTKVADVRGEPAVVDFAFPAGDVKAIVEIVDESTPPIAVSGLDEEALLRAVPGKEVDVTLFAEHLDEAAVPAADKTAIEAISGELTLTYYDFSVLLEIFQDKQLEYSEYLKNTTTVLEVAVPFDSTQAAGTYVFRCHEGEALRFEQLAEKPTGDFRDGTYYVTIDTVYVYTNCFSTYAIGYADTGTVAQGSEMLIFSDGATVNVADKAVTMYYSHDSSATHSARVELYLVGKEENLLIAQSGIIPPGNELSVMPLKAKDAELPSDASYEGLMRIIYLGADGKAADTNVELPVTVTIVRDEQQ